MNSFLSEAHRRVSLVRCGSTSLPLSFCLNNYQSLWSIHSSIHPSIQPFIYLSIHSSTCPMCPSVRRSVRPSVRPSVWQSVSQSTNQTMHLSLCLSACVYVSIYSFILRIYIAPSQMNYSRRIILYSLTPRTFRSLSVRVCVFILWFCLCLIMFMSFMRFISLLVLL